MRPAMSRGYGKSPRLLFIRQVGFLGTDAIWCENSPRPTTDSIRGSLRYE
jgi:hypothetical protein